MRTTKSVIWFVSLAVLAGPSLGNPGVESMERLSPAGLKERMANHKATLLFFFVNDCPISRRDVSVVNELRRSRSRDDVEVVAVFVGPDSPGPSESRLAFDRLTIVSDGDRRLVDMVGARVTPEYFVFDRSGTLRYQGAFDDYALGLARHRKRVTKRYVADASIPQPNTFR